MHFSLTVRLESLIELPSPSSKSCLAHEATSPGKPSAFCMD